MNIFFPVSLTPTMFSKITLIFMTILSILPALFSLALLILLHELGHFIIARLCSMRIDVFSIGFGPALFQKKIGETTYQIAAIPLGGYVQIAGMGMEEEDADEKNPSSIHKDPRAFQNRPAWQRFFTAFAGPFMNYKIAILLFLGLFSFRYQPTFVESIDLNSPASASGLQVGDQLLEINHRPIMRTYDALESIYLSEGNPLLFTIHRSITKERKQLLITPVKDKEKPQFHRIYVSFQSKVEHYEQPSFIAIIKESFVRPVSISIATLKKIFTSSPKKLLSQSEGLQSPLMIVKIMAQSMNKSWMEAIYFIATISMLLGLFNLLPIPALDGGKMLFTSIEMVFRRPIHRKFEQWLQVGSIFFLLSLTVYLLLRDLIHLIFSH